jgi:hypothetical protein
MTRFCPYCGVAVPSDCETCPKCFKKLPSEGHQTRQEDFQDGNVTRERTEPKKEAPRLGADKSRTVMLLLSVVPAFFGILGLAQLFRDFRDRSGYVFLVVGLVFFIPSVIIITGVWDNGAFVGIFRILSYLLLTVIYLSAALASVLDALYGSVFKVFKF